MKAVMLKSIAGLICSALLSCGPSTIGTSEKWTDLSQRTKPPTITQNPWQEVVINVENFSDVAPFFTQIAGFETRAKYDNHWLLAAPGSKSGFVRLVKIGPAVSARPAQSRAWDKGCYFSLMMRAKNLPSIIEDAKALGWQPLTDMAYLEFGPSKLNIIVLTHESGMRVQLYERLSTPVPEAFPFFERLSQPFNIMQMVEDRDAAYDFFHQQLGFDTFFYGPPYVSKTETVMPLGIPLKLTTKIPYKTGIMTPKTGLEWGRMEVIDIEGMPDGVNYSQRCNHAHTGLISVRFDVANLELTEQTLTARAVDVTRQTNAYDISFLTVKTPDGANIEFYQLPAAMIPPRLQ